MWLRLGAGPCGRFKPLVHFGRVMVDSLLARPTPRSGAQVRAQAQTDRQKDALEFKRPRLNVMLRVAEAPSCSESLRKSHALSAASPARGRNALGAAEIYNLLFWL